MLLLLAKCLPRPPLSPPPSPNLRLYYITSTPSIEHFRGHSHGELCGHYRCVLEGYRLRFPLLMYAKLCSNCKNEKDWNFCLCKTVWRENINTDLRTCWVLYKVMYCLWYFLFQSGRFQEGVLEHIRMY